MTERITIVAPPDLVPARGYSHGVAAGGRTLHIAGQIGWNLQGVLPDDFVGQFAQALDNVLSVIREAGGEPTDLVQMTVYVTDVQQYRSSTSALGPIWKERLGRHYPAMALVGVVGLVHPQSLLEIEATAALADL